MNFGQVGILPRSTKVALSEGFIKINGVQVGQIVSAFPHEPWADQIGTTGFADIQVFQYIEASCVVIVIDSKMCCTGSRVGKALFVSLTFI